MANWGMRRLLLLLFGAIFVVGVIGESGIALWDYVFGGVSEFWRDVVSALQKFDLWLIEIGMFPALFAVGLLGVLAVLEWPRFWRWLWRYDAARKDFETQFDTTAESRDYIRTYAARHYSK